jgi:hypothetical protein
MKRQGNGCKISVLKSKRDSKGRSIKASDIYQDMATTIFLTSVSLKINRKSPKEIH